MGGGAKLFSYSKWLFDKMPPTEATPATTATTYQATKEHPSTFGQVESAREVADRKCEVVEGLVKLKQFQMLCSKWLRWEILGNPSSSGELKLETARRKFAEQRGDDLQQQAWPRIGEVFKLNFEGIYQVFVAVLVDSTHVLLGQWFAHIYSWKDLTLIFFWERRVASSSEPEWHVRRRHFAAFQIATVQSLQSIVHAILYGVYTLIFILHCLGMFQTCFFTLFVPVTLDSRDIFSDIELHEALNMAPLVNDCN